MHQLTDETRDSAMRAEHADHEGRGSYRGTSR